MARPSVIVAACALASAACTVLSGVDSLELRSGAAVAPPDDPAQTAGDAAAEASPDAAGGTSTVPCATDVECQEERCRKDLPDSRLDAQVGSCLFVTASCKAGTPRVVNRGRTTITSPTCAAPSPRSPTRPPCSPSRR